MSASGIDDILFILKVLGVLGVATVLALVVLGIFAILEAAYHRCHRMVDDIEANRALVGASTRHNRVAAQQPLQQLGATHEERSRIVTKTVRLGNRRGCRTVEQACAVCLEPLRRQQRERIDRLPCGHWYHHRCIDQWLRRSNVCPECRGSVI